MKKTYSGADMTLKNKNYNARKFTQKYNQMDPADTQGHYAALKSFLGQIGENSKIYSPFYCDIGENIFIGKNCTINYDAIFLDMDKITIGNNVRIAPKCSIYTVSHPLDHIERANRICFTEEVVIGDDTWICGDVTILPGVHIGARCVIGAKSLVSHDIPDDSLAYGNPCQVIRKLSTEDEK